MMIMKVPRVGRSFIPKAYMVPEPEWDANIVFENNHELQVKKMGIEYQVQSEVDEAVKELQMLQQIGISVPAFDDKLSRPNYMHGLDYYRPWNFFYSHQGSAN
ncbi:uncharacterized protein LOC117170143 isoform X2 [Belonocnema kinseyi]|nr:uncharacterized protein LOC117170143 isoform X2 [Belonocnema kinseyi]